jgi:hypothetical protein
VQFGNMSSLKSAVKDFEEEVFKKVSRRSSYKSRRDHRGPGNPVLIEGRIG